MRLSAMLFSLGSLAVLAVPTLLIVRSVATLSPLSSLDYMGLAALLSAAGMAWIAATGLYTSASRSASRAAGALTIGGGLLFALAIGWLFGLAGFSVPG